MFVYVLAVFNYVLFAWSSSLIDISVVTILFELWPILHIIFIAWLFRREERYARVTIGMVALLCVCFLGVSLTILSQIESVDELVSSASSPMIVAVQLGESVRTLARAHPALALWIVILVVIPAGVISFLPTMNRVERWFRYDSQPTLRGITSKARRLSRRVPNQLSRLPIVYRSVIFLIGFLVIATGGYLVLNRLVGVAQESDEAWQVLLGCVMAIGASVMGAAVGYLHRWGSDLSAQYLPEGASVEETWRTELQFVMLGVAVGHIPMLLVLAGVAISRSGSLIVWHGDSPDVLSLWQVGLAIVVMWPFATYFWRKAVVTTHSLGVNSISFFTPVAALAVLWFFGQVDVAHNDYLVIGAAAIVIGNLIINFDAEEQRRSGFRWLGFKSLILSLWFFGAFVYLRDPVAEVMGWKSAWLWQGAEFFPALALSATVFTLILSFRVARLVERTTAEENLGFAVFSKLEYLVQRGVVDHAILDHILKIDVSEQRPVELQDSYTAAIRYIAEAKKEAGDGDGRDLSEVEAELNALVHSKQQGPGFGELSALWVFAGITVFLALVSRPLGVTGWTAFLIDMFAMIFSSVIVFLIFNVGDLRQERVQPTLRRGIRGIEAYALVFRNIHSRIFEEWFSIVVGGALIAMYSFLLWSKWF